MRVAYDVFEVPLYSVYPVLLVEVVFDAAFLVWILDGLVDVVVYVVVDY